MMTSYLLTVLCPQETWQQVGLGAGQVQPGQPLLPGRSHRADGGICGHPGGFPATAFQGGSESLYYRLVLTFTRGNQRVPLVLC